MANGTIYSKSLNDIYDSVIWTHKIQRTYLEKLENDYKICRIAQIVATSITSIPTVILSFLDYKILTIIFAVCTIVSILFGEIINKLEIENKIKKFKESSSKLWLLKNDINVFSDEINGGIFTDETVKIKIEFYCKLFDVYCSNLPTIPNKIVNLASEKLKTRHDEENDFSVVDD